MTVFKALVPVLRALLTLAVLLGFAAATVYLFPSRVPAVVPWGTSAGGDPVIPLALLVLVGGIGGVVAVSRIWMRQINDDRRAYAMLPALTFAIVSGTGLLALALDAMVGAQHGRRPDIGDLPEWAFLAGLWVWIGAGAVLWGFVLIEPWERELVRRVEARDPATPGRRRFTGTAEFLDGAQLTAPVAGDPVLAWRVMGFRAHQGRRGEVVPEKVGTGVARRSVPLLIARPKGPSVQVPRALLEGAPITNRIKAGSKLTPPEIADALREEEAIAFQVHALRPGARVAAFGMVERSEDGSLRLVPGRTFEAEVTALERRGD